MELLILPWFPVSPVSVRNLESGAATETTRDFGLEKSVEGSAHPGSRTQSKTFLPLKFPSVGVTGMQLAKQRCGPLGGGFKLRGSQSSVSSTAWKMDSRLVLDSI